MKNKKSIIIPIVLLAIGFASISTTLIINGNIGVQTNTDGFIDGVVFDTESLVPSNGTTAEISESGRTLSFTTQNMTSVGETASVRFKIKNYSQYNATLDSPAISCYFVNAHQIDTKADSNGTTNEYMKIAVGSELNGTTITAGGGLSLESSVTVEQIKSSIEDNQEVKFQCEINATAGDTDTPSIEKASSYTVSFDSNKGDAVDSISVKPGEAYGELPTPTRVGYDFDGWFTDKTNGDKIESTTIVSITADQTLYAHWTAHTYAINYNLDSGTAGEKHPTSATYGTSVNISNPTRDGYIFAGWTITSGLDTSTAKYGTRKYEVTVAITDNTTKIKAEYFKNLTTGTSVTLTANWIIPIELPERVTLINDINNNGIANEGDKIRVGDTESFYVIGHTETEINALAEYNLNVGSNPVPNETYGIQNKDARGYVEGATTYGNVRFSKISTWTEVEPLSIPITNVELRYDTEVNPSDPDQYSALDALYTTNETAGITGYQDYIKGIVPDSVKPKISVRLINKGELEELVGITTPIIGISNIKNRIDDKGYEWLYYSTYWLQNAHPSDTNYVWWLGSTGGIRSNYFYLTDDFGVRPVITISK